MNRRTAKARDARKAHAALVRRQLRRRREGLASMTRAADRAAEAIRRLGASTVGAALSARDLSRALNCRCLCDVTPRPSLVEWIKGPHRGYRVVFNPSFHRLTLSVRYLVRGQSVGMEECLSWNEVNVSDWRFRVADTLRKIRWHAQRYARGVPA